MVFQLSLLAFLLFWLFAVGLLFFWRFKRGRELRSALDMELLSVKLPSVLPEGDPAAAEKEWKKFAQTAEQFFGSLHGILSTARVGIFIKPAVAFEIAVPSVGKEISFFVAAPHPLIEIIEKQIHSFYPMADIAPAGEDYNIFNPEGGVALAAVRRRREAILPIKTYEDFSADAVEGMVTALSKVDERGEGAALQIVLTPAPAAWQYKIRLLAQHLKQGESVRKALRGAGVATGLLGVSRAIGRETFDAFKNASPKAQEEEEKKRSKEQKLSPIEEELLKRIEARALKPGFLANIRFVASSQNDAHARELLGHMDATVGQFTLPQFGSLASHHVSGAKLRNAIHDYTYRLFRKNQSFLMDGAELASFFHFPTPFLKNLPIASVRARQAPPPTNLPKEGVILGRSTFRGQESEIRMTREDRRRHLYIIGQTGVGKSVLLENLIVQDILAGDGCCFIDPHGDTAERILAAVPKERARDVIYFNPTDLERPMGLNMLEYDPAYSEQKTFIANEVITIFRKIWEDVPEAFGPMFEQYMRNALLLVMEDPATGNTLMEIPRVLADPAFRKLKLSRCRNPIVKDFWELEAEKAGGEAKLENMVPYITSKTNVFIANDYMRPIIAQQHSAFNFREIMDSGKILIVNLSKGRLGDMNASLLGLIIVGRLLFAALSRTDTSDQEKRRDFYLYIDEFQNFATESIAVILSEARKYRLNLVVAHQFIAQLTDKIRDAVFGNVGSFAMFRVGAQDAEFLEKYTLPVFTKQDLINIDNRACYVKLLINNFTSEPFNMGTIAPYPGNPEMAHALKEYSRLKYGKDRAEIEKPRERA